MQSSSTCDKKAALGAGLAACAARTVGSIFSLLGRPVSMRSYVPSAGVDFMKPFPSSAPKRLLYVTLLTSVFCALLPQPARAQQPSSPQTALAGSRPLITQPIDESQLTILKGNTHFLARPQFDLGTASATLPMQRMLLVLKRSPEQESALRQLLDNQQDKSSPSYHKWLTPDEFGGQFGPTDADMHTIAA